MVRPPSFRSIVIAQPGELTMQMIRIALLSVASLAAIVAVPEAAQANNYWRRQGRQTQRYFERQGRQLHRQWDRGARSYRRDHRYYGPRRYGWGRPHRGGVSIGRFGVYW